MPLFCISDLLAAGVRCVDHLNYSPINSLPSSEFDHHIGGERTVATDAACEGARYPVTDDVNCYRFLIDDFF